MSNEKPREFWIDLARYFRGPVTDVATERIHVIEYEAYEALEKLFHNKHAECVRLIEENTQLKAKLAALKAIGHKWPKS